MSEEERIEVELTQNEIQEMIYCYEKDLKYIKQLEQQNKELHNKIDKAYKIVKDVSYGLNINFDDVLEILKGDVNE